MKLKLKNIIIILIPILLFIVISIFVQTGLSLKYELKIYNYIILLNSKQFDIFFKIITNLVSPICIVVICLLTMIFESTRKKIGIHLLCCVVISSMFNLLLKLIFSRQRPDLLSIVHETGYSFPSAHAMVGFSMYTVITLFVLKNIKNLFLKNMLSILLLLIAILICISRVYLGVHYFCDIFAGALLGFDISYIVWCVTKRKELLNE